MRKLDIEYGAAELERDDPLVEEARKAGWKRHDEGFNEDAAMLREDGEIFSLSGSQYSCLCVVYDASRWRLVYEVEEEAG